MSLINEVLEDLDARQATPGPSPVKLVDQAAQPDSGRPGTDWARLLTWLAVVSLVVGYAVWEWLRGPVPAAAPEFLPVAVAPVEVPVQRPVEPAAAQPAPSPAPSPTTSTAQAVAPVPAGEVAAAALSTIESLADLVTTRVEPALATIGSADAGSAAMEAVAAPPLEPLPVPLREPVKRPVREAAPGTLALARERIAAGRLAEAEAELRTVLARSPSARQARELLVGLLVRGGRDDEALAVLHAGLERYPEHMPFRLTAAHLRARANDVDGAIGMLEGTRLTDPNATLLLATLYQQSGRHAEAVPLYRALVARAPASGRYQAGLGMALEASRQVPEAIDAYRRALARGGVEPVVRDYLVARLGALAPTP